MLFRSYLLDSLQIPYLPIDLRVSGKGFSESYKEKFIKTFGNDLQYIPVHLESDIPIELFLFNKNLATERDVIYEQLLIGFEYFVVSYSVIPVKGKLHKSIWLVETYCKSVNSYGTILYYENFDGKFQTIFENYLPIPYGALSKINYE